MVFGIFYFIHRCLEILINNVLCDPFFYWFDEAGDGDPEVAARFLKIEFHCLLLNSFSFLLFCRRCFYLSWRVDGCVFTWFHEFIWCFYRFQRSSRCFWIASYREHCLIFRLTLKRWFFIKQNVMRKSESLMLFIWAFANHVSLYFNYRRSWWSLTNFLNSLFAL